MLVWCAECESPSQPKAEVNCHGFPREPRSVILSRIPMLVSPRQYRVSETQLEVVLWHLEVSHTVVRIAVEVPSPLEQK